MTELKTEGIPGSVFQTISELEEGSDRACAIVGGAFAEERLRRALENVVRRDMKLRKQFFSFRGPMGSFAAKIELGYLLGLYEDQPYIELSAIKDIRNRFAHFHEIANFTAPEIVKLCSNFKINSVFPEFFGAREGKPVTARSHFEAAISAVFEYLPDRSEMIIPPEIARIREAKP